MMDYREFVDQVAEDIKDFLPESLQGASVKTTETEKLQGESYYGIVVRPENSIMGITMDLRDAYKQMYAGKDYGQILQDLTTTVCDAIDNHPEIELSQLLDYDSMKETLMLQVVSTESNEGMLANIPHKEVEDMSIVYRFVCENYENASATILVTNDLLERYGITAEQLHEDAMANAPEQFPARVRSLQEILSESMGLDDEMMPADEMGMYVATCNNGINGAACVFYPEFMDQAAEQLGGDFFILPSSVHEMLLIADTGALSAHELQCMVQDVNDAAVEPQDKLTDSAYHYDSKDRVFEKADKFEARMQAKQKEKEQTHTKEKSSLMGKLDAKKKEAAVMDGGKKTPHKVNNAEL